MEKKKSTMLEKGIVAFLLALVRGDMDQGGGHLLAVCRGYPRDQKYVLGVRPFCTLAHGLYSLAQLLLSEDRFKALEMPNHKNFLPAFALWRREHPRPDLPLRFRYPEEMELFNGIYEAPPARLVLKPPAPEDKKQKWFAHGIKWVDGYADELWDMGIGQA